ncbi:MAG: cadherin-like domain-containing protein [Hyphomicrobium sp.]|nr:cadherin-like domain-containing protein [Hyphomicrobium sp.]
MGNIRIERVPIQEMGLWRIRADHLMLVFQQDPLDYGEFQDRWWVMEGTRDANPDGTFTVGVDGANGVTTLSAANGGLTPQELLDAIQYPWWRGSRIIQSTDSLSEWGLMAAVARDIDSQGYPYFAFNLEFSPLPTSNSSSVVASLLFYIGVDIAENLPFTFLTFTVGTRTLFGTSDDDQLTLAFSFNTILSGDGDDTLEGTQSTSQTEKLYGGRGDDVFLWTAGSHVYHGGQPGLDYAEDGTDAVDYTGIGVVTFEGVDSPVPHVRPQFIAIHATGIDKLFSIEDIRWDDRSDTLILGEGVRFEETQPFFDLKGQDREGSGDTIDFSLRKSSLMLAPSDRADVVLVGSRTAEGTFADGDRIWISSLERVIGSAGDDRIYASSTMTSVEGSAGNDLISGRFATPLSGASPLGFDIEMSGGDGDDTIVSGSGRSLALGGAGADTFVLGASSGTDRSLEFVIADADASDRFFVPYSFLKSETGTFEGSLLLPVLGTVTPTIGGASFDVLPQNGGPGAFNGTAAAGYFYLIGQVPLDDTIAHPSGAAVNITNQILFNRDGADLLIHIYSGSYAFDPMFLTLEEQDFTYQEYNFEFATEAVVRIVDFQEGMLGINFYELGDELPFPFPAGSGNPDASKLWNTAQFEQAGGTFLKDALEAEPETPNFDRPPEGEADTRDVISGTDDNDVLAVATEAARTSFSSGANLFGFDGNDELTGGRGRDILDGGAGDDIMAGGGGNDRYIVDSLGDLVVELQNAGIDTVISSVGFSLPDNVEHLSLTGSAAFGQGNASDNRLIGSVNADVLNGLGGDDTLVGAAGDDVLDGGLGDDTYVYQAGDGIDVILASQDATDWDVLRFIGFGTADVGIFQSSDLSAIVLRLADGGRVILDNFFAGASIDAVGFDDETIWDSAFLTVAALQSGPLLNDAPIAGAEDEFFSYARDVVIPSSQLLANDRDVDGDPLTIVAASSTTSGAAVSVTPGGDVTVVAAQGYTGLVTFTYTVSDGRGGQTIAAANLTIVPNAEPALTGAALANQQVNAGQYFSYAIPINTFSDADAHPLFYSADRADGSALPSWLTFNSATREFHGTPPPGFSGDIEIRVTASDSIASSSTTFVVSVAGNVPGLTLVGTAGRDVLTGAAGNDSITGGRGNDTLSGLGGDDVFFVSGNAGFDDYDGGDGFDIIRGSSGNDIIGLRGVTGLIGIEAIDGGDGFDILRLDGSANVLDLTGVTLTSIKQIEGGGGGDLITGSDGDDIIVGGSGNDILAGGLGNDTFVFSGRQGRDSFDGGAGFDTIRGSDGADILFLNRGTDDLISIEAIDLGEGIDILRTGSGADIVDLSVIAVSGLERIETGGGNDRIIGTAANEILSGGFGQDVFVFRGQFGHDIIEDFQLFLGPRRNGDMIDVSGLGFQSFFDILANTQQVGPDSVIRDTETDSSITLLNIAKSLLEPDDFVV